jgi:toxin ParE1/3/4
MGVVSKSVRLHPQARSELEDSVVFYRSHGGEILAARFKREVHASLRYISANPERFPPVNELLQTRRIRLTKFPFSIIYIVRPQFVWVVAIAHQKRKPEYWKERLS